MDPGKRLLHFTGKALAELGLLKMTHPVTADATASSGSRLERRPFGSCAPASEITPECPTPGVSCLLTASDKVITTNPKRGTGEGRGVCVCVMASQKIRRGTHDRRKPTLSLRVGARWAKTSSEWSPASSGFWPQIWTPGEREA